MGIRETLNQKPGITTGATAAIIFVALGIIVWQLLAGGSSGSGGGIGSNKYFFSDDDGKTWFADDTTKLPPFDHNGKPAYQAFVWTCDGGKTLFCSHLLRFTEEAKKKRMEARQKTPAGAGDPTLAMADVQGREVKLAGNGDDPKNWVKQTDPAAGKIVEPHCKSGTELEPVFP